jgi:hypothetical protein
MMMKTNQTSIKQNTQKRGRIKYKMKDPNLGKKKKLSTKADCKGNMNTLSIQTWRTARGT